MPHFSNCCGADEYICQKCAQVFCGQCQPSTWRPDITGHKSAGNVCPACLKKYQKNTPPAIPGKITKAEMEKFLKNKLATNRKWMLRALELVYEKQTEFEQQADATLVHNNQGFSSNDAYLLSSFVKQYREKKFLSKKQIEIISKRIPHYWMQVWSASDISKLNQIYWEESQQMNVFAKTN